MSYNYEQVVPAVLAAVAAIKTEVVEALVVDFERNFGQPRPVLSVQGNDQESILVENDHGGGLHGWDFAESEVETVEIEGIQDKYVELGMCTLWVARKRWPEIKVYTQSEYNPFSCVCCTHDFHKVDPQWLTEFEEELPEKFL